MSDYCLKSLARGFNFKRLPHLTVSVFICISISGCAVVAVTSTAISVTAGAVGLAADAAIGTAKIVGKGVGKAADALMDDEKPDNSGINIQYRDAASPDAAAVDAPLPATAEPITPQTTIQPIY